MSQSNGFSNFLLGLGLGVGLGLLFAPKSGEETREILKDKANEGKDFLTKRATELSEQAAVAMDKGRETLSRHRDTLIDALEVGKQAYRETVEPRAHVPVEPRSYTNGHGQVKTAV